MSEEEMLLNLKKKDLISLAKGTPPNYDVMKNPLIAPNGYYVGGMHDEWKWNYGAFQDNTMEEVLEAYKICKESWE
jgi:hypothetical protein